MNFPLLICNFITNHEMVDENDDGDEYISQIQHALFDRINAYLFSQAHMSWFMSFTGLFDVLYGINQRT